MTNPPLPALHGKTDGERLRPWQEQQSGWCSSWLPKNQHIRRSRPPPPNRPQLQPQQLLEESFRHGSQANTGCACLPETRLDLIVR